MPLRLLKGIRHFKNNQFKEQADVFTALSKGQAPDVLFFGCIDSRIDIRLVTNANLGELLVNRNPGNIVAPFSSTPSGEASSAEFALNHLHVAEIIVCGHSHCGAMKGLMIPGIEKELPNTSAWLSHAKPALDHLEDQHPELNDDPSLKLKLLTQDNILLQIEHLKTHPAVAKRLDEGNLKIHGWYYEFENGEIHIYNANKGGFISFEKTVDEIALTKLNQIVEEEALNYLNNLTPVQNIDHYTQLKRFSAMNPVASIWEPIKNKVRSKAQVELGELYLTSNGSLSPQFDALLKKGPLVQVQISQNKYQQIEHVFNQALNYQSNHLLSDEQKKLFAAVITLKEHTLSQFAAPDKLFDFNNCMHLAKSTQDLTDKLMTNRATSLDIEAFKNIQKPFESTTSSTDILNIIVTTIAAIASGLVVGFLIAGFPGAAVGAVTCGVSAALTMGLWAPKKNPSQQVTNSAEQIISNTIDEEHYLVLSSPP
jgi:carbonic anhydrase